MPVGAQYSVVVRKVCADQTRRNFRYPHPSFAFRFDAPDRSVVISGDCRPSDSLVELASGADVLVHEIEHRASLRTLLDSAGMPEAERERIYGFMSDFHTNEAGRRCPDGWCRHSHAHPLPA